MISNPLLLIIGSVWPEPNSSAAGYRMMQIIESFQSNNWKIHFVSTAADSAFKFPLETINIDYSIVQLNHSSFDDFIKKLNPNAVLFDRFMVEEQFGWRVSEICPDAIKILDTEDLHFLRNARQTAFKEKRDVTENDLFSDLAKREIASIYRCDFSIIISEYEMNLLKSTFNIPAEILLYLPLSFDTKNINHGSSYNHRNDFFFIGNFYHEPNKQTVQILKEKIWPLLKKKLPDSELHIYGAYVSEHFLNLSNEKSGFIVKGRAENSEELFLKYRCLLAPIPFGAGLKGKILESMLYSCPFITTDIGAEGILDSTIFKDFIQNNHQNLIEATVDLYTNEVKWNEAIQLGHHCIRNKFNAESFKNTLIDKTNFVIQNRIEQRKLNFIGQLLQTEFNQSKKYLSKWIELKSSDSSK